MRVLVAPDKFKGTLTAEAAAAAIARGWAQNRRRDSLTRLPISDGGDGFGQLLGHHLNASRQTVRTVDAAGRAIEAHWWWVADERLAILESATVIGLARLPRGKFHPFTLDTFGLGAVLRAAAARRPRRCLVGVGGSATNDAGIGLARALGWRFLDADRRPILEWPRLDQLRVIQPPQRPPALGDLIVAVDVQNRLLGVRGATRVYGPQKGIRTEDVGPAEKAFRRVLTVLRAQGDPRVKAATLPGSGAAGGLGFGLAAFAGARIESGFDLFARLTGLTGQIQASDLVLTGEGALDLTSVAMGKGVGQIARLCRRFGVPCLGLAGVTDPDPRVQRAFTRVHALAPTLTTAADAMRQPARWLRRLAAETARTWVEAPLRPRRVTHSSSAGLAS